MVDFNPILQKVYKRHLWLLLSGLPIQFWSEEILINLGNHLGKFIVIDKDNMRSGDKKWLGNDGILYFERIGRVPIDKLGGFLF